MRPTRPGCVLAFAVAAAIAVAGPALAEPPSDPGPAKLLEGCRAKDKPNGMGVVLDCGELIVERSDWVKAQWPDLDAGSALDVSLEGMRNAMRRSEVRVERVRVAIRGVAQPGARFTVVSGERTIFAGTMVSVEDKDVIRVASCGARGADKAGLARCEPVLEHVATR